MGIKKLVTFVLLLTLVTGGVNAAAEDLNPSFGSGEKVAPEDAYSLLVEKLIAALRDGDEDVIRSMLSSTMLTRTERELGTDAIHRIISERFIPYFSDFASLDSTVNSVRTKDAEGHEGLAFFRSFTNTAGEEKPFVVYVINEGSKVVIGNLVLNKTMNSMGLNREAK